MTLTAVLFVGGLSTRMGRDKSLLPIAGEPLWSRQLNLLRRLKPAALCLSARSTPSWCPAGVAVVLDETPSRGPLSGLAAVLVQMKTSHLLVLAVDLPQMTVDSISQLLAQVQPGRGIVPRSQRGFEPLCAVYPRQAAPLARAALENRELSLQSFVKRLIAERLVAIHTISPSELGFFLNLNSPADLKKCR